jgi:hypothetical protein
MADSRGGAVGAGDDPANAISMNNRRNILRLFLLSVIAVLLLFVAYDKLRSGIPAELMAALKQAEQFELMSLDPEHAKIKEARTGQVSSDTVHAWVVLGRTVIDDSETREKLIAALEAGAKENRGMYAACFNPRHAIRVKRQGEVIDFVICFECLAVNVYEGGSEKHTMHFAISPTPQPVFDDVLTKAGIPLADKAE